MITTSEKQINNSLLSAESDDSSPEADEEKETRAERKEREALNKIKDEGEAFSKYMQFRNVFYTPENELVILAEKYHQYMYSSQNYSPGINGSAGRMSTNTYLVYECGDLLRCKIEVSSNIGWMQIFPKAQRKVIQVGSGSGFVSSGFFDVANRPFYAGFGAMQSSNAIHIFVNDNSKNAVVTQPGQKLKTANRFSRSDCYVLTVDEATGKCTRKMLFSNSDTPTSMPLLGSVVDVSMYIVGKEDRLFDQSKIAAGKITLK